MFGVFAIEEPGSPVPALYATLGWSKSETINKMLRNILPVTPNQTDTINITMHDHTFASHFTNHAIGFTSTLLYFTYSLHFKVNSTIHIFKHMGCMAEESPHFGLFGEHVDWFPRLLWEQFHRVLLVGNLRSVTKFIGKKIWALDNYKTFSAICSQVFRSIQGKKTVTWRVIGPQDTQNSFTRMQLVQPLLAISQNITPDYRLQFSANAFCEFYNIF